MWRIDSWRDYSAQQQIEYPDTSALDAALSTIGTLPPLVFPGEVDRLTEHLARAGRGETFVLQGGDCVERFVDCSPKTIADKLKVLLQMSVVLTYAARMPVLRIGRIAGQFFKPRSQSMETVNGLEFPTYRGDAVHAFEASSRARQPDPQRLVQAYFHASATLNYIRAMIAGGFADLHHPTQWNLRPIEDSHRWEQYRQIVANILDAIQFMESFRGVDSDQLNNIEFFTSHEALHLPYEQSLTRQDPDTGRWYNLSAHMVWIGERTRGPSEAHVEYASGISNPVGVKIGPDTTRDDLLRLVERLNPDNRPGRLTLISRLGAGAVESALPRLVRDVQEAGARVVWSCDPMHGNTVEVSERRKTRRFDDILDELNSTFLVHRTLGSNVSGVHFELTGDDVTECTGGAVDLQDGDLSRNYQTYCDPRLNESQSLEMAFLLATLLRKD